VFEERHLNGLLARRHRGMAEKEAGCRGITKSRRLG